MRKSMCITYVVENNLYVNITNKCSNRCDFCIRNNGDGAYGSDPLWLLREPTREEILESIFSHNILDFDELVFCGYGEPTYRLDDAVYVARSVKEKYPDTRIRINTNGQSDLILGRNTAPDYEGAFDIVSISLNTPNPKKYEEICHSHFGEQSHSALIKFAKNVKNYVQNTVFSVVRQFISGEELSECQRIADECGVYLKVREYIG